MSAVAVGIVGIAGANPKMICRFAKPMFASCLPRQLNLKIAMRRQHNLRHEATTIPLEWRAYGDSRGIEESPTEGKTGLGQESFRGLG
jgi:hypothetical protein